jgi:hypothetical protein
MARQPLSREEASYLNSWMMQHRFAPFRCTRGHEIAEVGAHAARVEVDGWPLIAITCPTCSQVDLLDLPTQPLRK